MIGGTAQKYCRWELVGEPYKKGEYYYIKAVHPATHVPLEVRWYSDKKHADLMPKKSAAVIRYEGGTTKLGEDKPITFAGQLFNFDNEEDYVVAISERCLTKEEETENFNYNWKKGGKWRYTTLFGGVWYAPKNTKLPTIANSRFFMIFWKDFVAEAQKHTMKLNGGKREGFWFSVPV